MHQWATKTKHAAARAGDRVSGVVNGMARDMSPSTRAIFNVASSDIRIFVTWCV